MAKSIAELLSEREGTRLDFKQDLSSMKRVLETTCSFLNTAGGTVVVGVEDQTRVALGLSDVEKQEEKLANAVANAIEPQPTVQLEMATYEGRDLLLLRASYAAGPFFIKERGKDQGTFVRIGSNSLPASPEKVAELERARQTGAWDQEPVAGLAREGSRPRVDQAVAGAGWGASDRRQVAQSRCVERIRRPTGPHSCRNHPIWARTGSPFSRCADPVRSVSRKRQEQAGS